MYKKEKMKDPLGRTAVGEEEAHPSSFFHGSLPL